MTFRFQLGSGCRGSLCDPSVGDLYVTGSPTSESTSQPELSGETEEAPPFSWREFKLDLLNRVRNLLRQELDRRPDDRSLEQLLTTGGVAEALNVSERTVEHLVDDGELTPIWIRGQRRFKPESVRNYIRRAAGRCA